MSPATLTTTAPADIVDQHLRKDYAKLLARRLDFIEMQDQDPQYEALKQKYRKPSAYAATPDSHPNATSNTSTSSISLCPPEWIRQEWKRMYRMGPGLVNGGNTCFMNATLQCLLYMPPFTQFLLDRNHSKQCRSVAYCALCEMERFAGMMLQEKQGQQHQARFPKAFVNGLRVIAKHMKVGRQEDAHEYLCHLLDAMERNCLMGLPK